MSPLGWYALLVGDSALILGAGLVLARRGLARFGCYADRMEAASIRAENAAIQLRACIGWLEDMRRFPPHDHPVVPPDSIPDDMEGAA